jgi:CRISPR/Cas system CMR subunit Cmr4 (Cas7 group RAMP superfamily)
MRRYRGERTPLKRDKKTWSTAVRIAELEQQNTQLSVQLASLAADYAALKRQIDWFKRQLFGAKSEQQRLIDPAVQGNLLAALGVAMQLLQGAPTETVTYTRRKARDNAVTDSGLRFDETVPVNTIVIGDPVIEALPESARERIGEKVTYRLA